MNVSGIKQLWSCLPTNATLIDVCVVSWTECDFVCVCVCVCVCVGASPATSSELLCSGWEWGHPEEQWLWPRDRPSPVHHQVLRVHTHTHTHTHTLSRTHTHTHNKSMHANKNNPSHTHTLTLTITKYAADKSRAVNHPCQMYLSKQETIRIYISHANNWCDQMWCISSEGSSCFDGFHVKTSLLYYIIT